MLSKLNLKNKNLHQAQEQDLWKITCLFKIYMKLRTFTENSHPKWDK